MGNYIENELVIPGVAEGTDLLLDLGDLGITDIPVNLLRKAASMAALTFRARTHKIFVMNTNWFIRKICNVFYSMTPEFTALKINIIESSQNRSFMGKYFDLDKLEKRFGGNRPDDKAWIFPPDPTNMISGVK